MRPKAILLDYGGTLVEELEYDPRPGNQLLFERAAYRPAHVTLEQVIERADKISTEVAARRDQTQIETPWPSLTRLIYDPLGIRFDDPLPELEMEFWKATVKTAPMPGAREALEEFHRCGVPTAVVSNCSYSQEVLRYELGKHGLADHLSFIMVSAEYAVRKPNVLLFETAAARLGAARLGAARLSAARLSAARLSAARLSAARLSATRLSATRLSATRLSMDPREIWFVGDRLDTDVAGADAAGMCSVWLRPMPGTESNSAYLTVDTWPEIVQHFRRA